MYLPDLLEGKREKWWCDLLCGALLDDLDNGGSVDVSCIYGEYGFSFMWFYSREWVWNSSTKLCCIASGKGNVSIVTLQEFDIKYMLF